MRRLLSFAAFLIIVLTASAYNLEEGQVWWGHYLEGMTTEGIGTEQSKIYNVAIFVPGDEAPQCQATIAAVRFILEQKTQNITSAKVWVSSELPASADAADLATKSVLNGVLGSGFNEAELANPVTIPATGVYVGVSYRVKAATVETEKHPVVVSPLEQPTPGACYFQEDDGSWSDFSDQYALALQVAISGPYLPLLSIQGKRFTNVVTAASSPLQLTIPVVNNGTTAIHDFDACLVVNGEKQEAKHFDLEGFDSFKVQTISFDWQASAAPGTQEIALLVESINNTAVDLPQSDVLGVVAVPSVQGHRRVVMEEFTGTWCSWCPRGMVGIELLDQAYGDDFVGIAIHRDKDPMVLDAYNYLPNYSSFPGCMLNRVIQTDPYGDAHNCTILDQVEACRNDRLCETDIEITAEIDEASADVVQVDVSTTFHFSAPFANEYALALVITADSLRPLDSTWYQSNIYSGNQDWAGSPGMDWLVDERGYLTNIVYNHVPVAVLGIENGINGSIDTRLVDGETQHYLAEVSLAEANLIQDKSQLHANALLIYRPTGEIINAAQCHILYSESSAINSVWRDTCPAACFDLFGRPQSRSVGRFSLVRDVQGHWRPNFVR